MGISSSPRDTVAYFEEVDSNDEPVEDSKHYARSTYARSATASPTKERPSPNSSKALYRSTPSDDSEDFPLEPSPPRKSSKMKKSSSKSKHVVVDKPQKRPGARGSKTTGTIPRLHDESSYYGVPAQRETVVSSSQRPRPRPRSETFSGPNQVPRSSRGPPPPHALMMPPHFPGGPPPPGYPSTPMGGPPPHMGSYPPPWAGPGGPPPPMGGPPPMRHQLPPPPSMGPGGPPDFIRGPGPLSKRFDRPQSAMGVRQPSGYEEPSHSLERIPNRRQSVSRKISKDHDDRSRMPPPPLPRPASARPSGGDRLAFRPPPPQLGIRDSRDSRRKPSRYEEDDFDDDNSVFYDSISQHHGPPGDFGAYDVDSDGELEPYRMVPATHNRRSRRQSQPMYELTDKLRRASLYQDDVDRNGGAPLTADALKQVRNGGSSRSTRSSASRDESDYRHSATTRTTRSGNVEDDITIKVPRGAIVEMGGAKMTFREGGDMSFGRGNNNKDNSNRDDNDQEDEYSDDEYERQERPSHRNRLLTHRSRAPSQGTAYQQYPRGLPYPSGAYGSSPFSSHGYAPPTAGGAFNYDHEDEYDTYGYY